MTARREVYLEAAELVSALKAIILELGVPLYVEINNPILDHIHLCARGDKEEGRWLFYIANKDETQEEGQVGHA